ncbi:MAG: hypothetical protein AAF652_09290 [Cyanobacteria bacterium P01_C01_bin.72]
MQARSPYDEFTAFSRQKLGNAGEFSSTDNPILNQSMMNIMVAIALA